MLATRWRHCRKGTAQKGPITSQAGGESGPKRTSPNAARPGASTARRSPLSQKRFCPSALSGGEGDVPALLLGDELQRAAPGVHRRDEGQAAAGALALEVPAAEPPAEKFLPRRAFSVFFPETLHACLPLPPVFCRRLFF